MSDLSSASLGSAPLPGAHRFSSVQRAALDALIAEAEGGTGCVALIGEAGIGKTAVLDMTAALLGHPPVQVIRVGGGVAPLTSKRLIAQIIGSEADDEAAEAIEQALARLLIPASPWTRTILMVDDAHALKRDALAYLQLMCGLQAPDANSLQIVFAGRPEFWSLLASEHLRSLRERIRIRPILPPVPPPLIEPPDTASDVPPAVLPGAAVPTLPQHVAGRELWAPARRRRPGTRFAVASGFTATVMIASVGSLSRDPPTTGMPMITAGYAAPVRVAVGARSVPLRRRVAAEPIAPAFSHPLSAAPTVAIELVAAAPRADATGGAPAATTPGPSAAAGAGPAPQADATVGPPAPTTPGPSAAAGTPPAGPAASQTAGRPPLAASAAAIGNPVLHRPSSSNPPAAATTPTPVPQPAAALSPALVASLLRHGDEMLQIGDIAAARLLFRRAAEAGSAAAAIAIGKTNDPRFLAEIGAQGIVPDPAAAADWYRRAAALGDRDADRLLDGLGASAAQ